MIQPSITMPKLYDVLAKWEYDHNGEKKVLWYRIGKFKSTENGGYLRLFHQPNEYYVVERPDGNSPQQEE